MRKAGISFWVSDTVTVRNQSIEKAEAAAAQQLPGASFRLSGPAARCSDYCDRADVNFNKLSTQKLSLLVLNVVYSPRSFESTSTCVFNDVTSSCT